jgi:hypothetical protein
VCYLAAGRPVVTQETGFSTYIPCGEGLFAYTTLQDAAAQLQAVSGEYERHSRAAAAIASEYFDAHKVVRGMLEQVGLL